MNNIRLSVLRRFVSKQKQKHPTNPKKSNFIIHKKKKKHQHQDIYFEGVNLNKIETMKDLIFSEEVLTRQEKDFQIESNFEIIDMVESEGLVKIPKRDQKIAQKVLEETEKEFVTPLIGEEQEDVKSSRKAKEKPVETEEQFFKEMNRLNKTFEKDDFLYHEGGLRNTLEDYKQKQIESARSKLSFNDLLKIYIKFLQNPKVQKEKYVNIFATYQQNPKEGFKLIKANMSVLSHHSEMIFFLKAFANASSELESWEIWRIWDKIEHPVVEASRYCSLEEMSMIADLLTKINVVSSKFVHEYEEMILDSKSELFSIERAEIFNKFYKIVSFFVSQKEIRSEFLFDISRWSILMFK
jgi:uncharacterized short protein YbdD (DUF466 family)